MKQTFNDLTLDELIAKREELYGKMKDFRLNNILGHVENPLEKRNLRRQIARLHTMIKEYEIGIRKV